jgi:hypothetical protein
MRLVPLLGCSGGFALPKLSRRKLTLMPRKTMTKHLNFILKIIIFAVTLTSCGSKKSNFVEEEKGLALSKDAKLKSEIEFKSLDKIQVLKRLFDNPIIDSSGTALWEPNYIERMYLPISFDNKCHTNIDTILFFNDHMNVKCAVVLFAHYNFVIDYLDSNKIEIGGSHFDGVPLGIALFKQSKDNTWEIYKFSKHFSNLGYFGTYRTGRQDQGKINLKEIGDRWTCLTLRQGVGGSTGASWGYESLYSIEELQFGNQQSEDEVEEWYDDHLLQNILTYNYHYSYNSLETKESVDKKSDLRIIRKKNNYYDLELSITKNGKTNSEIYYYSESKNKFIKR